MKKKHPTPYIEGMEIIGTKEEMNAPVAAAIGEESRDDKKLQNSNTKIKTFEKHYVNILTF